MFDGRFASLADLPADADFSACVREAIALNAPANRPKRPARAPKPALPMPADFSAALKRSAKARAAFDHFPPSHRREYIEWIADARRDERCAASRGSSLIARSAGQEGVVGVGELEVVTAQDGHALDRDLAAKGDPTDLPATSPHP